MKKAIATLCAIINLITGCNNSDDNNDVWKQAYEEKKFETEMTNKAKDFIEWFYEVGKKSAEEQDEDSTFFDRFKLDFVRLGNENKNYGVFSSKVLDEEGDTKDHTFMAINLTEWDPSMPFQPDSESGPFKDVTIFGDLTRTKDGMGFICGEDCYALGPNAELHNGLIFEEATPTSKDLEKLAAIKESLKANRASKAISSFYGLSEERSFQLSKTILSWKKVSNQRAMTKRDLDHLTVEFAGVKASEIVESFKDLAKGDEARFNNLIERAARVNEVSPEAVKAMIQDAFMK